METGIYFRFGKENIDWLDLTDGQKEEVTKDWNVENWKRMSEHLTNVILDLSEELRKVENEKSWLSSYYSHDTPY